MKTRGAGRPPRSDGAKTSVAERHLGRLALRSSLLRRQPVHAPTEAKLERKLRLKPGRSKEDGGHRAVTQSLMTKHDDGIRAVGNLDQAPARRALGLLELGEMHWRTVRTLTSVSFSTTPVVLPQSACQIPGTAARANSRSWSPTPIIVVEGFAPLLATGSANATTTADANEAQKFRPGSDIIVASPERDQFCRSDLR